MEDLQLTKQSVKKQNRHKLCVKKRNGDLVPVSVDSITERIDKLCDMEPALDIEIDPFQITQLVVSRIEDSISTSLIDSFTADICASKITEHYHYGILASRLIIDDHHKTLSKSTGLLYSDVCKVLYNNVDNSGYKCPILADDFYDYVIANEEFVNSIIDMKRDFLLDYFGFKTLLRSYLLKINNNGVQQIVECPQHLFLRVAIALSIRDGNPSGSLGNPAGIFDSLGNPEISARISAEFPPLDSHVKDRIKETYDYLSMKYYVHATPTLFNAGTRYPNYISCFLLKMEDSVDGIFKCLGDSAKISKWAGGIGIHISEIRSKGSYIRKTNGNSDGIVPMLSVYNKTVKYINQCFVPETIIYTLQGPKYIKDICIGDLVVTMDGSFKPVMEIFKNEVSKEIREICTSCSIKCTDVHQILVLSKDSLNIEGNNNQELKFCPEYMDAKDIKKGDYLCFPKPTYEKDYDITEDECKLYGKMIVDNKIMDIENKYLNLPVNKLLKILEGLFEKSSSLETSGVPSVKNVLSKQILDSLRYISLKVGVIMLSEGDDDAEFFEHNGIIYSRIKYNKSIQYSGTVYDLSIQDNHNYLTEGGLVHNSGKRNGSIAMYIEPWHADIFDFIDSKMPGGNPEIKSRDLFYALWIPDNFMRAVEQDSDWYLMDPSVCSGLANCYGVQYEELYNNYVSSNKYTLKIKARELWEKIINSQMETGGPYMLFKDSVNRKSNHMNIGTVRSSNLCTEIVEYSDENKYACCVLASVVFQHM